MSIVNLLRAQAPTIQSALQGVGASTMTTRSEAFYQLLQLSGRTNGSIETKVRATLRLWPKQAPEIKSALIATLETESAYRAAIEASGQSLTEDFLNYSLDLITAVGTLHDVRSLKGLLAAASSETPAGEYVADFCPTAIDDVITALNGKERVWQGVQLNSRAHLLYILRHCLERPALMRQNPGTAAKVRATLLKALDDADPAVRNVAADALALLRTDAEVQTKLEDVSLHDPYSRPVFGHPELASQYIIRGTAAFSLKPFDANRYGYVVRTTDTLACSVQTMSNASPGQMFIGPVVDATDQMCRHYDPAGTDPAQCWTITPANVCGR